MPLDTIGSIAVHIDLTFGLTGNVSGTMVDTVDMNRISVQNFTGASIGSNAISEEFQNVITQFSKADAIDAVNAQKGGEKTKLAELSIDDSGDQVSAKQWRDAGNSSLKALGRTYGVARSIGAR
ncbi:hypothetical protein LCGC14_1997290 [marine sediment metagenome]|uniref:Uncharacterized protein n=1 Tax=marine sediment metagenome TaxID=412755 RepID=A0A0F9HHR5_9ZZZZ